MELFYILIILLKFRLITYAHTFWQIKKTFFAPVSWFQLIRITIAADSYVTGMAKVLDEMFSYLLLEI